MFVLAGGAVLRESVTIDEVAHIGAGVSYLQKLDLRFNEEHPPLAKVLAALPLVARGTRADYSGTIWNVSQDFFPAYLGQWIFGEYVLTRWNQPGSTLAWARLPMLLLTIALGWVGIRLRSPTWRRLGRSALPGRLRHHARVSGLRSSGIDRHSGHALLPPVSLGTGPSVGSA